jgi:hypothetical protein
MNPSQANAIAMQRHDLDLAACRRHIPVARRRTSLSTLVGLALISTGSRLVADRRGSVRTTY